MNGKNDILQSWGWRDENDLLKTKMMENVILQNGGLKVTDYRKLMD